jgi:hypothetical protein
MKKMIFAAMMLLVAISSSATSFIGLDADTMRINPNRLTGYWQVPVVADFGGYADTWQVSVTYPGGVIPKLVAGITALEGMTVGYTDPTGTMQTYEAPLQVSAMYETLSSTTAGIYGYYDYNYDGVYETYGNIKWEPGKHQMWEFNLYIPADFRRGYIIFDGTINSGYDARGAILSNVRSYKRTWLWVGYERGDVNGDGKVNITDATMLINCISMCTDDFDEFQLAAADFNGDGEINISDAVVLINYIKNK